MAFFTVFFDFIAGLFAELENLKIGDVPITGILISFMIVSMVVCFFGAARRRRGGVALSWLYRTFIRCKLLVLRSQSICLRFAAHFSQRFWM